MKEKIQGFGKVLSGMIMPNIGAFIAWGLITALFIPSGWYPNAQIAQLVNPMLNYLLPILIAYTGGKYIGGERGGIMGAISVMGVIVGADIPMFIGAMLMGPFAGWVIKTFDHWADGKVKAGFEMLVNNFSVGILGMGCALIGFFSIQPIVTFFTHLLSTGILWVMNQGILPFVSLFIEPGKIFFLNNAINHGIISPIGIEQAQQMGYSTLFLLEANPGPGLGVLIAYWAFSKGNAKSSAPGAIIIHFFGGIHEIYFPYVLANLRLLAATILGSMGGILFFVIAQIGLVAPASPGSIFALIAMAPKAKILGVLTGVAISTIISFCVASPFVKNAAMKDISKDASKSADKQKGFISKIYFVCDAGMGSSAMGATRFKKRIEQLHCSIIVRNYAIDAIPQDADIIVCQAQLAERAHQKVPHAELIALDNFLISDKLDTLYKRIERQSKQQDPTYTPVTLHNEVVQITKSGNSVEEISSNIKQQILPLTNIQLQLPSEKKEEAILRAGELLATHGYVKTDYQQAMIEREKIATTYIGNGIAIPHGTSASKDAVIQSGIVFLQYPQGVDFGDEKAYIVIGIAGKENEHLEILAELASTLEDEQILEQLIHTQDAAFVWETLNKPESHTDC